MSLKFKLNDGAQIPWLGFGTGTALFNKDSTEAVKVAIQTGVTHLDGAQLYRNEESLGQGIKDSGIPREKLFVTTKLAETPTAPTIKATLEESLRKLSLDYVDLFLIHSPVVALREGKLKQWWKEMEEIKKGGLAKSIGVSNFTVEHLQIILEDATVVPAVNQLHPYVWDVASKIYSFCKDKGIVIESYGGLSPIVRAPGGPVDPVLASAAERLSKESGTNVSPGQVLSKWLIQKDVVVVTTSSKVSRIEEALLTASLPDLTVDEIFAIETEGSKVHKRFFMKHVFNE
ncbi:NADP-dependent oxidoreductase domain-containing protein [Lentinula aff. lateritia]|uniref:NADP-dependent oxidoreductase domain-containing protein n=1 Tax=Lentinula aff. lateritia TaxID=2804960 RepID=A0ACC1TTE1_9AGAR|nr:NADP-dependent oxidoreductase domain-containing protein [Lentinula aff. lateritia]